MSAQSPERIVQVNGVDLCLQTFGNPNDPPILLIHGMSASMLWWEDEFCERLAAGHRFVIRYDHRDTGRSVTYPPGAPGYTARDLNEDAIGILDALNLPTAHVVGFSMGGGIAQELGRDYPDRVTSLTLISTSTAAPDLPPPDERYLAYRRTAAAPDWSDRAAAIDGTVAEMRAVAGISRPFDESVARELVARDFDRAINYESGITNHPILDSGGLPSELPGVIHAPALVIHGEEDPAFPLPHALALVAAIPGSKLLALPHTGHELPCHTWDTVVPAILDHTASN